MLGRKIIIQFLGVSLSSFLGFLSLSLTARLFGASLMGEVNYFLGVLGLVLLFSDLGFSRAHIKFVADKKKIKEKLGVFLSVKSLLLTLFFATAFFYFYFFLRDTSSSYKTFAFFLLLFYELFNRFGIAILTTFESLRLVVTQNFVLEVGKVCRLVCLIFSFFFLKNIVGLSLSYFMEGFIIFILACFFIRRFLPLSWKKETFKRYFRYSLPFFAIYPLSYIQSNLDVVILRNFWTASVVGYYSAALGLASFSKTLYGVLITLFFPKISQLSAENKKDEVQRYTDLAVKYLLFFFVPLFLSLYFFRDELIGLFLGPDFGPSVEIFAFALLGVFILMLSSVYDHVLYATGRHKILVPLNFLSVFLMVLLQLAFVPKTLFSFRLLGLAGKGAILAKAISWFFAASVQIYLTYKLCDIRPFFRGLVILVFGFFILVSFWILNLNSEGFFKKISFLIIANVVFYILLRISGVINSADRKYFRKLIKLKNLIKEGLDEFE